MSVESLPSGSLFDKLIMQLGALEHLRQDLTAIRLPVAGFCQILGETTRLHRGRTHGFGAAVFECARARRLVRGHEFAEHFVEGHLNGRLHERVRAELILFGERTTVFEDLEVA